LKQVETIFENQEFIALNKTAGLLSIPDRSQSQPSLKDMLQAKYGNIHTVHRLDRDTSGLILFAKTEAMHKYLCGLFEKRQTEKKYLGIVYGIFPATEGKLEFPIAPDPHIAGKMRVDPKGKPAETRYRTIEKFPRFSLVEFNLITGRTHQIRVHAAQAGHALAGDPLYGNGEPIYLSSLKKKFNLGRNEETERPLFNRLALHSHELHFVDQQQQGHQLLAPLPKDMSAFLKQLRKLNP
jgi:23S rRNA pseudouridine1911/1915/1917 synthase